MNKEENVTKLTKIISRKI